MARKPPRTILYFYVLNAAFIAKDIAMLSRHCRVKVHRYSAPEKWKTPLLFLSQLWFLLREGWSPRTALVVQFGGYHSLLPVLWGKWRACPSVVVVGGTDCVSFPSLRYGSFSHPLRAWFTRLSYRYAHTVSAVHGSLFFRDNPYAGEAERLQGIDHFVPGLRYRREVWYNGYDTHLFALQTAWSNRPKWSFITVSGSLDDSVRMRLKGIDLVLELARRLPHAEFTLVGSRKPGAVAPLPNVHLLPFIPNEDLPGLYNQHRFYLQLSLSEGFPNALCEAMSCGCIPVVSAVASMPEIVGETGMVLSRKDPDLLAESLQRLYPGWGDETAKAASESIARRYRWDTRESQWKNWLDRFLP